MPGIVVYRIFHVSKICHVDSGASVFLITGCVFTNSSFHENSSKGEHLYLNLTGDIEVKTSASYLTYWSLRKCYHTSVSWNYKKFSASWAIYSEISRHLNVEPFKNIHRAVRRHYKNVKTQESPPPPPRWRSWCLSSKTTGIFTTRDRAGHPSRRTGLGTQVELEKFRSRVRKGRQLHLGRWELWVLIGARQPWDHCRTAERRLRGHRWGRSTWGAQEVLPAGHAPRLLSRTSFTAGWWRNWNELSVARSLEPRSVLHEVTRWVMCADREPTPLSGRRAVRRACRTCDVTGRRAPRRYVLVRW